MLILVGVTDECIVGFVFVQVVFCDESQAALVSVKPNLDLHLVSIIQNCDECDQNCYQGDKHAEVNDDIRFGADFAACQLEKRLAVFGTDDIVWYEIVISLSKIEKITRVAVASPSVVVELQFGKEVLRYGI